MGKIKAGILGGFSGRVGNVVGSSWKGIDVIKSMPLSVSNPRTTSQTNQRSKFAGVVHFASQINSSVIKPLNDRFALRQSGYNAFVSRNINAFANDGSLDSPANVEIARGKMEPPSFGAITPGNDDVVVEISPVADGPYESADDEIYLVIADNGFVSEVKDNVRSAVTTRDAGDVAIWYPDSMESGDSFTLYMCARRKDGTVVSMTNVETGLTKP